VYNDFNGIVFALEIEVGGTTIVRLNPGQYKIPKTKENNVHVYMICENKEDADKVEIWEMTNEEI
jgi:hypothetical protein